jgi:GMP synthase (glutamine-hydrolysing)
MKKSLAIIDCSVKDPAYSCFNRLQREVEENLNYYNFPKYGLSSFDHQPKANGIIALGSHSNIGDGSSWHLPLTSYLLDKLDEGIAVLGICFSHQMMAHAFGSTLKENNHGKCLEGLREVSMPKPIFKMEKDKLSFFTSHNYQIDSLSPDLEVIGSSIDSPFEFVKHKRLPYWGIQSHPEGSNFFIKNEISLELSSKKIETGLQDGLYLIKKFISSV